jgi:hypothetical protein
MSLPEPVQILEVIESLSLHFRGSVETLRVKISSISESKQTLGVIIFSA